MDGELTILEHQVVPGTNDKGVRLQDEVVRLVAKAMNEEGSCLGCRRLEHFRLLGGHLQCLARYRYVIDYEHPLAGDDVRHTHQNGWLISHNPIVVTAGETDGIELFSEHGGEHRRWQDTTLCYADDDLGIISQHFQGKLFAELAEALPGDLSNAPVPVRIGAHDVPTEARRGGARPGPQARSPRG